MKFSRLIFIVMILAIAAAVTLVLYSNRYSQQSQIQLLEMEKQRTRELFNAQTDRLRHAEMVIESQKVSGAGKVIETVVLFCPYATDASGHDSALGIRRVVIPGNIVTIDGMVLSFEKDFIEGVDFLAGKKLTVFGHLYGEGQAPAEENLLWPSFMDSRLQQDPKQSSTAIERRIWMTVRELILHSEEAKRRNVTIEQKTPASRVVRTGMLYSVWLGSAIGVEIQEDASRARRVEELIRLSERMRQREAQ